MEAAWASPQGFARKVAALARPTDIGPKALRAHNTRLVVGALMAIGLALLLYRSQRDAGFAILVALGGAAGWLLSGRVASLICLAEVIALAGWLWSGSLPWTTGLVQIAIVTSVTGLAHLAPEIRQHLLPFAPAGRRSFAQATSAALCASSPIASGGPCSSWRPSTVRAHCTGCSRRPPAMAQRSTSFSNTCWTHWPV